MNSATVMSLSDIFMFCNSVGIVLPFQEPCYGVKKSHGRILAKRRDYGKPNIIFLIFRRRYLPLAVGCGIISTFPILETGDL